MSYAPEPIPLGTTVTSVCSGLSGFVHALRESSFLNLRGIELL
jgi:hypothetical protein